MKHITSTVHGDHVLITVELPEQHVTTKQSGHVAITMQDIEWRQTSRAVLRECNAAEHKLPPEAIVQRVRESLTDAAIRAVEAESGHVARLRFASTVLHRLADMMQAGTIVDVEIDWSRDAQHLVHVAFQTERRSCDLTVELGKGVIDSCGCPRDYITDDGDWQHVEGCHRAGAAA